MENTIYHTKATANGGRDGKVISEDGVLDLEVRVPKTMGGAGGAFTNPEQLFAAGYAACFDSALSYIARLQKMKIASEVSATVGLKNSATEGFNLQVNLEVAITGVDKSTAQDLLEKAHATCPYSKAIRNNVDVTVTLVESE